MMEPLDLSPAALRFLSRTGPPLPAGVLEALSLPGEAELYGGDGTPGAEGSERGSSLCPRGEPEVQDEVVYEFAGRGARGVDGVLLAPGGGRELAFQLLAADALITWACEAAAGAREPDRLLQDVVSALTVPTP